MTESASTKLFRLILQIEEKARYSDDTYLMPEIVLLIKLSESVAALEAKLEAMDREIRRLPPSIRNEFRRRVAAQEALDKP